MFEGSAERIVAVYFFFVVLSVKVRVQLVVVESYASMVYEYVLPFDAVTVPAWLFTLPPSNVYVTLFVLSVAVVSNSASTALSRNAFSPITYAFSVSVSQGTSVKYFVEPSRVVCDHSNTWPFAV